MRNVWHQVPRLGFSAIAFAVALGASGANARVGEAIAMTESAAPASEFAGLWHVTVGSDTSCRLALTLRPYGQGLAVDLEGCAGRPALASVRSWTVSRGGVDLRAGDGSVAYALSASGPDRLRGSLVRGGDIRLERAPE